MSDCCKVIYGETAAYSNSMVNFYVGNSIYSKGAENNIDPYNWNHFVLTYFYALEYKGYTYYLTFRNNQYYNGGNYNIKIYYSNWSAPKDVILSQIIFCTYDENLKVGKQILRNECKKAEWLDGFYRKLQIFDLKYSARYPAFYVHQFEDDGVNGMIKHRYIFGLNTIKDNHLIDTIGGKNGYVPWIYDTIANQNPDKINYIVYEANYAPQGGILNWGSANAVSDYTYKRPELEISKSIKDSKCLIVQGSGYCLSCKPGYSLFSKECKGEINNNNQGATYFYKNPGKNMPERVTLNIDFETIKNTPYITIFFFIKIYGFIKEITAYDKDDDGFVKLLIFHEEMDETGKMKDDLYLAWTPSQTDNQNEKLYFCYKDKKLFSYPYFREHNFGQWVPISFAAQFYIKI